MSLRSRMGRYAGPPTDPPEPRTVTLTVDYYCTRTQDGSCPDWEVELDAAPDGEWWWPTDGAGPGTTQCPYCLGPGEPVEDVSRRVEAMCEPDPDRQRDERGER